MGRGLVPLPPTKGVVKDLITSEYSFKSDTLRVYTIEDNTLVTNIPEFSKKYPSNPTMCTKLLVWLALNYSGCMSQVL